MPDDHEALFDALAGGLKVEKAAEQFDMPVEKVRELLKVEIERCLSGEHMRETWTLADRRLEAVEHKFYRKAIEGDGDTAAAMVFVKVNGRTRAILNGANMPSHHVLEVVKRQAPQISSTERIYEVISRIAALPEPEPKGAELKPSSNGEATDPD